MTNNEQLIKFKKNNRKRLINAFFIGFLVGIIFYSFAKNSWGFFTLIPLFFIYKLIKNNSKNNKTS
jgi:hypothetical protein